MTVSQALLLTGPPGSGKTTIIRKAVERLAVKVGGFYTAEIREEGRRTGFEIVTLEGERTLLSHARFAFPQRVGPYGVDVEAMERVGVAAMRRAIRLGLVVVVDEIGKMELYSEAFREAVVEALEQGRRLLGTILLAPHPWADRVKRDPRVRLLSVTRDNRDAVLQEVLTWLTESSALAHGVARKHCVEERR